VKPAQEDEMSVTVLERMQTPGPKKILACDGGGILGLMSVEILARMETDRGAKLGRPNLVLADYFDFVCGTSTGAVIATCIAIGMSMDKLRGFYVGSGEQMFDKAAFFNRLHYSYNDEPLAAKLRAEFNLALNYAADAPAATLGDARLRTLLMMVMRNHTTDSPWPHGDGAGRAVQLDRAQAVRLRALRPGRHPGRIGRTGPGRREGGKRSGDGFGEIHSGHSARRTGVCGGARRIEAPRQLCMSAPSPA